MRLPGNFFLLELLMSDPGAVVSLMERVTSDCRVKGRSHKSVMKEMDGMEGMVTEGRTEVRGPP